MSNLLALLDVFSSGNLKVHTYFVIDAGKYFSEALNLASTNPQMNKNENCKLRTPAGVLRLQFSCTELVIRTWDILII